MKKHLKKLRKGVVGLTTASVTTSVGASIAGQAGSHAGASALQGMAGFYPAMGTMMAGPSMA